MSRIVLFFDYGLKSFTMRNLFVCAIFGTFLLFNCSNKSTDPQDIVDRSIEVSGGEIYNQLDLEFDFRERHYRIVRNNGLFQFERHFQDSTGMVKDVVTNDGFQRFVGEVLVTVEDSMATKYYNSINSVQYFVLLPYGLNDEAVNKSYLGKVNLKGQDYHKIQITFDQEGGGKDFEDVFVYWIRTDNYEVDYLAYSYLTDGGGMRFREAFNERMIKGLRILDYNNYKPNSRDIDLHDLDRLFESGELTLLSKIENKNVVVN